MLGIGLAIASLVHSQDMDRAFSAANALVRSLPCGDAVRGKLFGAMLVPGMREKRVDTLLKGYGYTGFLLGGIGAPWHRSYDKLGLHILLRGGEVVRY